MPLPITATIITLNEEENVEAAVSSAARVCNQVIVVDSESTDRTVELARRAGAEVVIQPYLGDGPQKHHGVQFATNDWILSLDADERLSDELVRAIEGLDLDGTAEASFAFSRRTFVGEQWIKVWYPDFTTRLYHKARAAYAPEIGHASVIGSPTRKIRADILHYSFAGYAQVVGGTRKFAERGARQVAERGSAVSCLSPLIHGLWAFIKNFVIARGIFHGIDGLNISVNAAYVAYMKYAIALEMKRKG